MVFTEAARAAPAIAGNDPCKFVSRAEQTAKDTEHCRDEQEFLAELRAERRRCDLLRVSLDCIGLAVSKGVWSVSDAKAARRNLPVIGPDKFTADFLAEVMRDPPPRKTWRRGA